MREKTPEIIYIYIKKKIEYVQEKRREPEIARECLRRETTTSFQSLPPFASCERICYVFKKSKTDLALATSAIQLTIDKDCCKLSCDSMLFISNKREKNIVVNVKTLLYLLLLFIQLFFFFFIASNSVCLPIGICHVGSHVLISLHRG